MAKAGRIIPTDQFLALINANLPSATNPFATIADLVAAAFTLPTAVNYSALPLATSVPNQIYNVLSPQGTSWLPWTLGGTYYPKGIYQSIAGVWEYVGEFPYQALQSEVGTEVGDGGTENTKFVTAQTLYGKGYSRINKIAAEVIPAHRVVILSGNDILLFDPSDPTHYNKVLGISYNSGNLGDAITVITDDEVTFGIPLVDGVVYYGGPSGTLVSTAPSTGIMQPIGMSNASGRFIVHIGTPILKA